MIETRSIWQILRQRLLPNGSRGERAYHRLRLGLLRLTHSRLGKVFSFLRASLALERLSGAPQPGDPARAYAAWMRAHEPSPAQLETQREAWKTWTQPPLITIVTPVYNPASAVLSDTLRSVLAQTYPRWEWHLADASDQPGPAALLDEAALHDTRLHVTHLDKNLGIAANTNAALANATGDYVLLLDHDDLLAPDALFEIAAAIHRQPAADVIYYDEDKLSADGRQRAEPWFKPACFSPIVLFSNNFLMHCTIRTQLLRRVLPLDSNLDGVQDWDLAFRLSNLKPTFVHIARVLYHWRKVPGSVAAAYDAKPWVFEAQKRCLNAQLERMGLADARAEFNGPGVLRIHWPISEISVSILIPTRDNVCKLRPCLSAILNSTRHLNIEVLVIDNASQQPETHAYYQSLAAQPRVRLLSYPYPFNYQRVNNLAVDYARGDILVFLNDDTQPLTPDWLDELCGWLRLPEIGIVGARLLHPDGLIQHGGVVIGLGGHGSHLFAGARENTFGPFGSSEWYRDCLAVTGACLALTRQFFCELGGFDEAYQLCYGDFDLCLRAIAAGRRVVYNPFARLIHHEGASRGGSFPPGDVLRASAAMLPQIIRGDPYFNPNLSAFAHIPALPASREPDRQTVVEKILRDFELYSPQISPVPQHTGWWKSVQPMRAANTSLEYRKVLFVLQGLSQTSTPRLLLNLALSLANTSIDFQVLCPAKLPIAADFERAGIPVHIITQALDDARLILPLAQACDLILVQGIFAWRSVHAARAMGKVVLWFIEEGPSGKALADRSISIQQAFKAAHGVFFPNPEIRNWYLTYLPAHQPAAPDPFSLLGLGSDDLFNWEMP